jgi:hypothetical protein
MISNIVNIPNDTDSLDEASLKVSETLLQSRRKGQGVSEPWFKTTFKR